MARSPITAMRLWNMLHFLAFGIVFPFLPVLLESCGLSPSQIGLAFTVGNIAGGLFSYYMGRLSDRVGRLRMLVSTTLLVALSYLLLYLESDAITTVAFFTLLMIGGGAANTIVTAYSMDVLEQRGSSHGGGFGLIRIGGSIGWIPGTFLGGILVNMLGLRPIFLLAGVIVGLSALTCYGLNESRVAVRGTAERVMARSFLRGPAGTLLLVSTLAFTANAAFLSFLSLHMINNLGATPPQVSAAFAVMGLAEIPGMIYLGRLSDRLGRLPILIVCLAAFPLRLAISGLAGDTYVVILAQALNSLTYGGLFVVSIAYASEIVSERVRGAYMGLYGATFSMGGVIGGYLWGIIAEATSYATMFLYSSAFSLIPVIIAAVALKAYSTAEPKFKKRVSRITPHQR